MMVHDDIDPDPARLCRDTGVQVVFNQLSVVTGEGG